MRRLNAARQRERTSQTRILEGCPTVVPVSRPRPMLLPCCRRRGRGQLYLQLLLRRRTRLLSRSRSSPSRSKQFDQEKRTAYFREVVDRANRMNYILPISSLPAAYAMNKDVKIVSDAFSYASVYLNDLVWSDYAGK
jgi:hypothetical protein